MTKPRIRIITYPAQGRAGFLSDFSRLLLPLCEGLVAITGDIPEIHNEAVHIIKVPFHEREGHSLFSRIIKFASTQLRILPKLIKMSRSCNTIIFFDLAELYTMLIFTTKFFLRKKVVIVHCGLTSNSLKVTQDRHLPILGTIASQIVRILEKASFSLADGMAVESESIVKAHGLERYRSKIHICVSRYLDTSSFKIKRDIKARENLVGYIGRFGEDKGAINFAKAIDKIAKPDDVKFLMLGGSNTELSKIEEILKRNNLRHKITLIGFVPRERIPDYLNELKLLVLPSYTEGLPMTILEAMACGTPVLATPVGGIPDVIEDKVSGFILEDNSPECIARNIVRALEYPELDQITRNAHNLVERKYAFEPTLKEWEEAFDSWGINQRMVPPRVKGEVPK